MVEIKNFNAKGDGITNDTAAVQAALDSGEVVHFTPGTYLCGTSPESVLPEVLLPLLRQRVFSAALIWTM